MGQRKMDKPPTKTKRSAERAKPPEEPDADLRRVLLRAAETCQQRFLDKPTRYAYHLSAILEALERDPRLIDPVYKKVQAIQASRAAASGAAVVTAIGGVPVRRAAMTKDPQTGEDVPVINKDGVPVWQRIQGRKWEGRSMVAKTRWAIAAYDADPLDVAASVIRDLPPPLKADCRKYGETNPERVGLAIKRLLGDGNLRSALIANRGDSGAANVDYKTLVANPEIVANIERADQANFDLLGHDDWEQIPAKVFRAILEALGHPKPGNLTRG
jgi:hypothetical protein